MLYDYDSRLAGSDTEDLLESIEIVTWKELDWADCQGGGIWYSSEILF